MLAVGEEELICDFAEIYHVLNMRELPATTAAVLACGLSQDSRIGRKLSGERQPLDIQLLAIIADKLGFIAWAKTKDGEKGRNRPKSIYQTLTAAVNTSSKPDVFASSTEFEEMRQVLLNRK